MAYKMTIDYRPEGKYPFALNTEADQIPLTREELESLKHACECALLDSDPNYNEGAFK